MQTIELNVSGMTCGHCVSHVEKAIHELSPATEVKVDLSSGKVTMSADASEKLEAILAKLADEGYPANQNKTQETKKTGSCRSGGACCCG